MSKKKVNSTEMVARTRNKALSCSTPEHYGEDSPSRDSDSIYDSDRGSPVPFLCTQDGAEGETDVVWNFYTPKSNIATSQYKNTTPVRRKGKKVRPKLLNKSIAKQRPIKPSQKRNELFQELLELNKNVHDYIAKKPQNKPEKPQSEEDIFSDNSDISPKSILRSSSYCLRKNVLSSKFGKAESENGLESDDSMNECLLKASQLVEENVFEQKPTKRPYNMNLSKLKNKKDLDIIVNNDSIDAIFNDIQFESPSFKILKKCNSPKINNDSFDNLLENLNDSTLDRLSQMPLKYETKKTPLRNESWNLKELVVHDNNAVFSRHNSMPESPSASDLNKPSTSGMGFGRYNSMPFNKSINKGDSPIKCTPDEIEMKRKQAREKLLAKRLLPFTQQASQATLPQQRKFNPRVPISKDTNIQQEKKDMTDRTNSIRNIKSIIEKKRQEALLRLRKRQQQNK